jgi:hypothetical protein
LGRHFLYIFAPLGWVHDRLSTAIEVEPSLVELLFDLDRVRIFEENSFTKASWFVGRESD